MQKIIAVVGATASGKSSFAVKLAKDFNAEIISADSIQIYKDLDIGSAKPKLAEQNGIKHHLISQLDLNQKFNSALFKSMAEKAIFEITSRGKLPIVCGSAMLYIKCLIYGIADIPKIPLKIKQQAQKMYFDKGKDHCLKFLKDLAPEDSYNLEDPQRIKRALEVAIYTGISITKFQKQHQFKSKKYDCLYLQVNPKTRSELYTKINQRVKDMLEEGLVEEVKKLMDQEVDMSLKPLQAIGYKQVIEYLKGQISFAEMQNAIQKKTRNYAKRQLSWYRSQTNIHIFEKYNSTVYETVKNFIKSD